MQPTAPTITGRGHLANRLAREAQADGLTDAERTRRCHELWDAVQPLVRRWVATRRNAGVPASICDEVEADGYRAMVAALRVYDPARGSFSTCLGWHLFASKQNASRDSQSILVPRQRYDAGFRVDVWHPGQEILESVPARDDAAAEEEDREDFLAMGRGFLATMLGQLSPRQREALVSRHGLDGGEPRLFKDVADALGCTKQRAQQLEQAAVERLRALARSTGGAA